MITQDMMANPPKKGLRENGIFFLTWQDFKNGNDVESTKKG